MTPEQLNRLLCPACKKTLRYDAAEQELICDDERLAFPIKDGIPVMLIDEARVLTASASSTPPENA